MMKKFVCLMLSIMLILSISVSALAASTTIPATSKSKGGASVTKTSNGDPSVSLSSVSVGSSIIFWVYKDGFRQVSPTYTFKSTGEKNVYYMPEYAADIVTNALYHPVWKKAETAQSGKEVKVIYTFTP